MQDLVARFDKFGVSFFNRRTAICVFSCGGAYTYHANDTGAGRTTLSPMARGTPITDGTVLRWDSPSCGALLILSYTPKGTATTWSLNSPLRATSGTHVAVPSCTAVTTGIETQTQSNIAASAAAKRRCQAIRWVGVLFIRCTAQVHLSRVIEQDTPHLYTP